jgi:ATP-binding cassette subfamily B protein
LRWEVLLLAVLLFSSIGFQLWTPQILRDFIDLAQTGGMSKALTHLAVIFFTLVILGRVMQLGQTYVTQDVRWRATNRMRGDLAAHCLALDMPFHNEQTPGTMIERIDGDVNQLSNFFSQFVVQILGNALLLIGVIALLFREDWRVGASFLAFVTVTAAVLSRTVSISGPLWEAQRQASSELFGFLEERLAGTEDIRANGAVPYVMRGLQRAIRNLFVRSRRAFIVGAALSWGFTEGMVALGTVLALGLGGYLLLRGQITIGTVYLIFHYNTMLQWPLNQLARQLRDLQSASGSITRIWELFETQPQVKDPAASAPTTQTPIPRALDPITQSPTSGTPATIAQYPAPGVSVPIAQSPGPRASHTVTLPPGPLAVQFEDVDFGYEDDGLVLEAMSWQLKPGDVLGILGRTGSGKTTVTRLLCRLYDPTRGTVRVGDVPLGRVALRELRQRVGVVTQDVQLFQATVRDNLTLFDPSIRDETIMATIDDLGLTRWYQDLAEGLDTEMGTQHGSGLSAGEAQLLAFMRIFLRDPGLVILDEASSRLDPLTEQLIERAIDRLLYNRTAVIVAHRLTTIQRAGKIMILEDGQIIEFGERITLAADPGSRFAHLLRTGMEEVLV